MSVTESIFDAARTTRALIKTWLGGDEKANKTTVHNTTQNVDADDWNKKVSGLAEVAMRIRKGNIYVVEFYIANATAGLSSQDLQVFGPDADRDSVVMPFGASVVACVAKCENAITANNATITPVINGTPSTTLPVTLDVSNQSAREYQLPGIEELAALEEIGCQISTHASFAAGTTPSIWVGIVLSVGEEEEI